MNLKADYRRYRRAFRQTLNTAYGQWAIREGFILRVESSDGVHFSEVAPLPEFGTETVERAAIFLREWVDDPIILPSGLPCCSFGVTAALQGLGHRAEGAVRDHTVAGLLPAGRDGLKVAEDKAASGYRSLKWKVGVAPVDQETEIFKAMLERLPESVGIRLDANASLNRDELEYWLECLAPWAQRIEYFEQPLPPGEESCMAGLADASGIAMALDESLNQPGSECWLTPGAWNGPLVIKALLMGNITLLMERLQPLARQVVFSSVFETAVGQHLALALADMLPEMDYALGFDTGTAFNDTLGTQLSGPAFSVDDRLRYDPNRIWNQLPPLS